MLLRHFQVFFSVAVLYLFYFSQAGVLELKCA